MRGLWVQKVGSAATGADLRYQKLGSRRIVLPASKFRRRTAIRKIAAYQKVGSRLTPLSGTATRHHPGFQELVSFQLAGIPASWGGVWRHRLCRYPRPVFAWGAAVGQAISSLPKWKVPPKKVNAGFRLKKRKNHEKHEKSGFEIISALRGQSLSGKFVGAI